ncbi:MAG: Mur ligase family protein, partial [Bacilli bacterium]
ISILTNITEDHLNVHKTIENYVKAKGKLFSATKKNGYCILNSDDLHYQEIKKISNGKIITYGKNSNSDFIIENINIYNNKTIFTLKHKYNNYVFESPYLTSYDVYNLTAAIIATNLLGASLNEIKSYIKEMPLVKGRFEIVKVPRSYKVIIDYAHTFNSIKSIINNVKKDIKGNLIVITGAAGGREKEKRREIGKFLLDNCSKVIFTMDDPRYESVFDITNDLIGNSNKLNYVTIPDRMQAIYYALEIGEKDDIIIILGKGADEYMAIFDKKLPYDEKQIINSYFLNMKSPF